MNSPARCAAPLFIALTCGLLPACSTPSTASRQGPLQLVPIERLTHDQQPLRGMLAIVHVCDPRVSFAVTPESVASPTAESTLATLELFALGQDCDVVINTNYFATVGPRRAEGYRAGVDADILGLCVHQGRVISAARDFEGQGDPALLIFPDRSARIACATDAAIEGVAFAAAGIGASESDPDRGTLLISNGTSTATTARVEPQVRHPRTAAGVSRDGRWLYLLTLDGRQPAWSAGATLEETATILLEFGVFDAVNLDGGGSTTMIWKDPQSRAWRTNRPSGGKPRPVAAGFGVRIGRGDR